MHCGALLAAAVGGVHLVLSARASQHPAVCPVHGPHVRAKDPQLDILVRSSNVPHVCALHTRIDRDEDMRNENVISAQLDACKTPTDQGASNALRCAMGLYRGCEPEVESSESLITTNELWDSLSVPLLREIELKLDHPEILQNGVDTESDQVAVLLHLLGDSPSAPKEDTPAVPHTDAEILQLCKTNLAAGLVAATEYVPSRTMFAALYSTHGSSVLKAATDAKTKARVCVLVLVLDGTMLRNVFDISPDAAEAMLAIVHSLPLRRRLVPIAAYAFRALRIYGRDLPGAPDVQWRTAIALYHTLHHNFEDARAAFAPCDAEQAEAVLSALESKKSVQRRLYNTMCDYASMTEVCLVRGRWHKLFKRSTIYLTPTAVAGMTCATLAAEGLDRPFDPMLRAKCVALALGVRSADSTGSLGKSCNCAYSSTGDKETQAYPTDVERAVLPHVAHRLSGALSAARRLLYTKTPRRTAANIAAVAHLASLVAPGPDTVSLAIEAALRQPSADVFRAVLGVARHSGDYGALAQKCVEDRMGGPLALALRLAAAFELALVEGRPPYDPAVERSGDVSEAALKLDAAILASGHTIVEAVNAATRAGEPMLAIVLSARFDNTIIPSRSMPQNLVLSRTLAARALCDANMWATEVGLVESPAASLMAFTAAMEDDAVAFFAALDADRDVVWRSAAYSWLAKRNDARIFPWRARTVPQIYSVSRGLYANVRSS